MSNERELLESICSIAVTNIMGECEHNTFPKIREIDDYKFKFMRVCLWHTNLWTSSKRKYTAKKLESLNVIHIVIESKYSPICVKFNDEKYNRMVYELCKKAIAGFNFISGNGFNSYPQFTRTDDGKDEIKNIAKVLFDAIVKDYNLVI